MDAIQRRGSSDALGQLHRLLGHFRSGAGGTRAGARYQTQGAVLVPGRRGVQRRVRHLRRQADVWDVHVLGWDIRNPVLRRLPTAALLRQVEGVDRRHSSSASDDAPAACNLRPLGAGAACTASAIEAGTTAGSIGAGATAGTDAASRCCPFTGPRIAATPNTTDTPSGRGTRADQADQSGVLAPSRSVRRNAPVGTSHRLPSAVTPLMARPVVLRHPRCHSVVLTPNCFRTFPPGSPLHPRDRRALTH